MKGAGKREENELIDKEKQEDDSLNTEEIEEALDSIPAEHRKMIEKMVISSVRMRGVVSPENAVMKKISGEHITQYLKGAEEEMKNSYEEKFQKKVFIFLTMLVAMVFFIIIIVLLKDSPDVMEKVLYAVGGVIAGAFGGYGLGQRKRE